MSEDSYTEVTHTSYGGRIKDSLKGIIFGLILFIGAFPLLFWNEGRAVKRYKTLKEGESVVISISPESVESEYNGRLVHMSGHADTRDILKDSVMKVSVNAIKLKRTVQMYQWEEKTETRTEKKVGGGEKKTTTYSYSRVWSSSLISSSNFKKQSGHQNPGSMPFKNLESTARNVKLGAFKLSGSLVNKINEYEHYTVEGDKIPSPLGRNGQKYSGGYYMGTDPNDPQIGDVRINFKVVKPLDISIVSKQSNKSFAPYHTQAGGDIELLQPGTHSAQAMFKRAHSINTMITWGVRVGGMFLMFIGLVMIFKPLSVFADVIPLFGNIIGAGAGILSFILALVFSILTIGVAWVVYRPVLGITLIVIASVLLIFGLMRRAKRGKEKAAAGLRPQATAAVPPPPPPGS